MFGLSFVIALVTMTDPYQGECTPKDMLNNPVTWSVGKEGRVPPTCLSWVEDWDHAVFERAKGAPLTTREHASRFYRWHRIHDPERTLFEDIPSAPLPTGIVLLVTAGGGPRNPEMEKEMTPMDLINEAFENSEGFTVNIWLRAGGELRNVNLITPPDGYKHPRDTHMRGGFQETGNSVSIDFCEVAALEIEE